MKTRRLHTTREIEFVGRMIYEKANGIPINDINQGLRLASTAKYKQIVIINIDGPCGHSARLAVDQEDVPNAKTDESRTDLHKSSSSMDSKKNISMASAIIIEAWNFETSAV